MHKEPPQSVSSAEERRYNRSNPKYWVGAVPGMDDFNVPITDAFIDGKTGMGPWAIMTPISFSSYGVTGRLGVGLGQRYEKQADGRWLKTQG